MQECEEYFKTQLGEEDKKVVSDVELDRENDEETLEKKIKKTLKKLKDKKAIGIDGIPAEIQKYNKEWVKELVQRICVEEFGREKVKYKNRMIVKGSDCAGEERRKVKEYRSVRNIEGDLDTYFI